MQITRSVLLTPITPTKATDQIVERLCEAISSGVLKPGDQLPVEAELAVQLDVAQMTLRQALEIMRERGLIETVRGRNGGSFVTKEAIKFANKSNAQSVRLQELQDIISYRMAIENEASALAAIRATKNDLGQLNLKLAGCLNHQSDGQDHWIADNEFHVAIGEIAKSPRLTKAISQTMYEMTIFFQPLVPNYAAFQSHFGEHKLIAEAIESGNPDQAWEASNQHLLAEEKILIETLFDSKP